MFALDLHFYYLYCYDVVSLTTTRRVTSLCCVLFKPALQLFPNTWPATFELLNSQSRPRELT
jgi:hypothetical protein